MIQAAIIVKNETGLHARPATLVVSCASKFNSDIKIHKSGKSINGKSILGLLSLGIMQNDEIILTADGADEEEALAALKALIEKPFID